MSVRYETRFVYDSMNPKFLGTVLKLSNALPGMGFGPESGFEPQRFNVLARQPFTQVFDIGSSAGTAEVAGATEVNGSFFVVFRGSPEEQEGLLEMPPWDVRIHAYNPQEDAAYVAEVLGIHIADVTPKTNILYECVLQAVKAVSWKKVA